MSRARTLASAIGSDGALNVGDVAGLHTVASTGLFSDLMSKPTTLAGYGITDAATQQYVADSIGEVEALALAGI
jgi:hypothetical protein